VEGYRPKPLHVIKLEASKKDAVLEKLGSAGIVLFSCHGRTDTESPGNSHILLNDRKLTVDDISTLQIKSVKLVVLSACSTAGVRFKNLAHELLHATGAFNSPDFVTP